MAVAGYGRPLKSLDHENLGALASPREPLHQLEVEKRRPKV